MPQPMQEQQQQAVLLRGDAQDRTALRMGLQGLCGQMLMTPLHMEA